MSTRLALGTVQFGLPYGITNRTGQVMPAEARAILEYASAKGLDTLDTAISYGNSEECLGKIGISGWRVVTKLPAVPDDCSDVFTWVHAALACSLERLHSDRVYGLLLHRPQQLLGPHGPALLRALFDLKENGLVEKVGVSIYDPAELDFLLRVFRPELVQAPLNVLDRRLVTSGWMRRLHAEGIEVHIRSIFLQGLLLMPASSRPRYFDRWAGLLEKWQNWVEGQGVTPLQACVSFALSYTEVARVIVGVENVAQLREIVSAASIPPVSAPHLSCEDRDLIEPSRWSIS